MSNKQAMTQPRIASIDIMRGLVILLMMLDHVRERFFMHTRTGDPIFDTVEPELFFTRFTTHFCAPICFWDVYWPMSRLGFTLTKFD